MLNVLYYSLRYYLIGWLICWLLIDWLVNLLAMCPVVNISCIFRMKISSIYANYKEMREEQDNRNNDCLLPQEKNRGLVSNKSIMN